MASCLCHLQINAWERGIGGGKCILHGSSDTQPSLDQKHPGLLTVWDTTRITRYLLLEEINVWFDIRRHVLMRANCVFAYGVGPLCMSWILTWTCGSRFDLDGWATPDVLFYLRHALAGHLVGIVGGTHRDFVLNTALTFQMLPAISKQKQEIHSELNYHAGKYTCGLVEISRNEFTVLKALIRIVWNSQTIKWCVIIWHHF